MSIRTHTLFKKILPFIQIRPYRRDSRGKDSRFRITVSSLIPIPLAEQAIALYAPCVACGEPIHPIRRQNKKSIKPTNKVYFACTCPLDINIACSRSARATDEYEALRTIVLEAAEGL